jgi:hypothetical protein
MHVHRRLAASFVASAALIIGGLAIIGTPLVASAHTISNIVGTVDCQGDYSITATGDVYGGHRLEVTLGGNSIVDKAEYGSKASQDFGPFTGTGGSVGEAITSFTEFHNGTVEQGTAATGELTLAEGLDCSPCATSQSPSPSPTDIVLTAVVQETCDPQLVVATCDNGTGNGSVNYTGTYVGDEIVIEPGDIFVSDTDTSGTVGSLAAGDYTFQFRNSDGDDISLDGASGSFTIAACEVSTPTPTPTPTATPTPTPTPTPVTTPTPTPTPTPVVPPVKPPVTPSTGADVLAGTPLGIPLVGLGAAMLAASIFFVPRIKRNAIDI